MLVEQKSSSRLSKPKVVGQSEVTPVTASVTVTSLMQPRTPTRSLGRGTSTRRTLTISRRRTVSWPFRTRPVVVHVTVGGASRSSRAGSGRRSRGQVSGGDNSDITAMLAAKQLGMMVTEVIRRQQDERKEAATKLNLPVVT